MKNPQPTFVALGSYIGWNGKSLESLQPGDQVRLHGSYNDLIVEFDGWTGEIALPRERGAVARIVFNSGCTDTRVAGELSIPN